MKLEVSLKYAAVFIAAVMSMTLLIPDLSVHRAFASEHVHRDASWQKSAISCPIARPQFGAEIGGRARENPLVRDLMSSAISIAAHM
jgi:hypothetical protein